MIQLLRVYSNQSWSRINNKTNHQSKYKNALFWWYWSKERHLRFVAHPLFCSHNWLGAWKSLINATNIVILTDGAFLKANIILKTHALNNETRTFWHKIFSNFWKDFINHVVIKKKSSWKHKQFSLVFQRSAGVSATSVLDFRLRGYKYFFHSVFTAMYIKKNVNL